MNRIDLNGIWTLSGRKESGRKPCVFSDGEFSLAASVPGNIELDLANAHIVDNPYQGLNAMQLRKYEFYEWCFRRDFKWEGGNAPADLVFEGLDCYATLFINGEVVGTSANALVPHRFEISGWLKDGINEIAVHIGSATNACRRHPYLPQAFSVVPFAYELIRVRKPAHAWGWDIAPRMALGGIFRNVFLEKKQPYEIEGYLQTDTIADESTRLTYTFKVDIPDSSFDDLLMTLDGECGDSRFHAEVAVWSPQGAVHFEIKAPRLWWPRNYGKQNLYDVSARLWRHSTSEILAERKFTFGLREITLKSLPLATDASEPDFQFYVNKIPIKVLGANHVPLDCLHSKDHERQDMMFDLANELNCNMLRVWGGGIYEDDSFYERCDREGIMVWQDFMMACSRYPNDHDFCNVMEREVAEAVRRLRQHPSIVLWCGDNECDCTLHYTTPSDPNRNVLTRKVIPDVCRLHDGSRPYLCSTPWCSPEAVKQAAERNDFPLFQVPEQHLWGGGYFKDDYYRKSPASFFSEIGYFGCPGVSSIQKFISEKNVSNMDSDEWKYHASNPFLGISDNWSGRIDKMKRQVSFLFGEVPEKLEDFALASQITQAEALKYFIELIRSSPKHSGILWWNLTDCWPQFSDAVVDYYFSKKLAFHYIKRLQKKILVMIFESSVIVSNYSNRPYSGTYRIFDADDKKPLSQESFELEANETLKMPHSIDTEQQQRLLLIEWTLDDGTSGCNHALCGKPFFSLDIYRRWLVQIAGLDKGFDPDYIGE